MILRNSAQRVVAPARLLEDVARSRTTAAACTSGPATSSRVCARRRNAERLGVPPLVGERRSPPRSPPRPSPRSAPSARSASSASGTASAGRPSARRQSAMMWFWSARPEIRRYAFISVSASCQRSCAVEGKPEDLADGRRTVGRALGLRGLASPRRARRPGRAARRRGRGVRSRRQLPRPGHAPELVHDVARQAERLRGVVARRCRRDAASRALRHGDQAYAVRAPRPERAGRNDERAAPKAARSSKMSRRRPTLPPSRPGSTIGAGGLNFRVRDGTGCFPSAMATETVSPDLPIGTSVEGASPRAELGNCDSEREQSQVLGLLVPVGSTRCRASTSGLSTSWSSRGLTWLTQWETSSRGEFRT